jgi:hypothetical protein
MAVECGCPESLRRPATCLTQPLHVSSLLPTLPQPTERCCRALDNILDIYRRQFVKVIVCGIIVGETVPSQRQPARIKQEPLPTEENINTKVTLYRNGDGELQNGCGWGYAVVCLESIDHTLFW